MDIKILYAVPAYGRVYTDDADILLDWLDGLDFRVISGSYFSIRDTKLLREQGYDVVSVDDYWIPTSL
jgi:hypothetical protein